MKYRIKTNLKLRDLEKYNFKKEIFDLSASIKNFEPEMFYYKIYQYKDNYYYIETNHTRPSKQDEELKEIHLFKANFDKPNKELKFSRFHKIVRIVLKDLAISGIIEKEEKNNEIQPI